MFSFLQENEEKQTFLIIIWYNKKLPPKKLDFPTYRVKMRNIFFL